jgi:CheY-like chemotaxis protein
MRQDLSRLDAVRTLNRDTVVVVVTTRNGPTTEATVLRAGASAHVRKPIDPLVLPAIFAKRVAR